MTSSADIRLLVIDRVRIVSSTELFIQLIDYTESHNDKMIGPVPSRIQSLRKVAALTVTSFRCSHWQRLLIPTQD